MLALLNSHPFHLRLLFLSDCEGTETQEEDH